MWHSQEFNMLNLIQSLDSKYSLCACTECGNQYKTKHAKSAQTRLSHLCHTCRNPVNEVLTQDLVRKHFNYDPITGYLSLRLPNSNLPKGTVVGTKTKFGYLNVGFQNKQHKVHRLIWLYQTGYMPEQVDHIDHDKTNNSWSNLREVTNQENQLNRPKMLSNSSGETAIHLCSKLNRYVVNVVSNNIRHHLGSFSSLEEAVLIRDAKYRELGFHPNHGT